LTAIARAVGMGIVALSCIGALHAAEPPQIRMQNGVGQLIVNGQPFLILGGELGNSSAGTAGIASVEQVSRNAGQWTVERRLNGDQTNQGRQLLLDMHVPHIYRVRLYTIQTEQAR
jgi:hypothetical protein